MRILLVLLLASCSYLPAEKPIADRGSMNWGDVISIPPGWRPYQWISYADLFPDKDGYRWVDGFCESLYDGQPSCADIQWCANLTEEIDLTDWARCSDHRRIDDSDFFNDPIPNCGEEDLGEPCWI